MAHVSWEGFKGGVSTAVGKTTHFITRPLFASPIRTLYRLGIASWLNPIMKGSTGLVETTFEGIETGVETAFNVVRNTRDAIIAVPYRGLEAVFMHKKKLLVDNASNMMHGLVNVAVASTRDMVGGTLTNGASAFSNSMKAVGNLMLFNLGDAKKRAGEAVGDARKSVTSLFSPVTSMVHTAGKVAATTRDAYGEYVEGYKRTWSDEKRYVGGVRYALRDALGTRDARRKARDDYKKEWEEKGKPHKPGEGEEGKKAEGAAPKKAKKKKSAAAAAHPAEHPPAGGGGAAHHPA